MRLFPLLLAACTGGPASPPSAPAPSPDAVAPALPTAPPVEAPAEARPLPEGRRPATAAEVAIVGFGARIALNPPFQATRMGGLFPDAGPETLVISWWDTTAPRAGQVGDAGLYNLIVVPREGTPADAAVTATVAGEPAAHVLRLGDAGTEIRLPAGFSSLGGAATFGPGPSEAEWRVEVGGATVPLERGPMLHSADPASGSPIKFAAMPERPWGAWSE